ncbi:RNA-directed DNA polymerase from mobile element jockey [Plakobranchus ocellatus]|uniref:RNA-directed DNA polymerase from mobile element jockey n=1 Tax=Plakobranchus ocellatus TaxID=259542 RepID=A0AAV4BU25_9GAST|nr:RNA-directed DNA polymerase from mobile element jockey [Plakobranchus ocellatus]
MDKWAETLDRGETVHCIYMDYEKAFDTAPHARLISKLRAYHISEQMINWIQSFLSGREQQVVVNGDRLDWKRVKSGIAKGSVLGPLMFVIFINDLPELADSDVYLLTDDNKNLKA